MQMTIDQNLFSKAIISWFEKSGRKQLPWQLNPTPYRVWISEIMLQQTQVSTVRPYYEKFISRFPDILTLANAPIDIVLNSWAGLGYYARARNLHKTAQLIQRQYQGHFPQQFDQIIALPGIGQSTAGAILALSMGERHPIMDGNVKRVLCRCYRVDGWPGKQVVNQHLWGLAEQLTPQNQVAAYTQAMMDLGALICKRTAPTCDCCPVQSFCKAFKDQKQHLYPFSKPKQITPVKQTNLLMVMKNNQAVLMEKRPEKGIWGGLVSFPECGMDKAVDYYCESHFQCQPNKITRWPMVKHAFTHYKLEITPILVNVESLPVVNLAKQYFWQDIYGSVKGGMATPVKKIFLQLINTHTGSEY